MLTFVKNAHINTTAVINTTTKQHVGSLVYATFEQEFMLIRALMPNTDNLLRFTSAQLREIADKLDELNASKRSQHDYSAPRP